MALLCPFCFENKGLQRRLIEIRPEYDEGRCDRHPNRKGIPIEAIASLIDEVFRANYTVAGADWVPWDGDEPGYYGPQRGSDLNDLLEELTGAEDSEIVERLIGQLIEDDFYWPGDEDSAFYDEEQRYERIMGDDGGHGALWERFCQTVTYEQRFLNPEVADLLGELFKRIEVQTDDARQSPIRLISPSDGLEIFRARAVNARERAEVLADPAGGLGPAPQRLGKTNRMNPAGIPAFYAALDLETCVSELRPKVGSEIAYGQFVLQREIAVLDTTRFAGMPKELNMFARDHVRRLTQWRFMQRFMAEIAKPISPDDEPFDYVPTQVVAEYLNKVLTVRLAKTERRIDGLIYRSAQRPAGMNIVLLGDAARLSATVEKPSIRSPNLGLGDAMRDQPSPATLGFVEKSARSTTIIAASFIRSPGTQMWAAPDPAQIADEAWPAFDLPEAAGQDVG